MSKVPRRLFLTGVTGALGREMLKVLLLSTDYHLSLLVRRKNKITHQERIQKVLSSLEIDRLTPSRITVYEGDVTLPDLGLKDSDQEKLIAETQEIYHIAALTALNGSAADCNRINLHGTEEVLKLAAACYRRGKLEKFFYFSTAYVAGSLQNYRSKEDSLPENPAHANFYESSKYEAEKKVRSAMKDGLPVTIFRPSIIVGDSKNGEVSEFNVIYPFMKLFAHGILTKLPTRLENTFNIVPIDFVVQAALAIARKKGSLGKTFHLVSKQPPSIGTLLEVKHREYSHLPDIEIVEPDQLHESHLDDKEQFVYGMLKPYLGYLNNHLNFDTQNTDEALSGAGIEFPKTDYDFLSKLTRYAVNAGYILA